MMPSLTAAPPPTIERTREEQETSAEQITLETWREAEAAANVHPKLRLISILRLLTGAVTGKPVRRIYF